MALRLSAINEIGGLEALREPWAALAESGGVFQSPRWLLAWWKSYQRQLGGNLACIAAFDGDELIGLMPLYRREAKRSPGIKVIELRLLGDAGPRPPVLDILAAPGREEEVGTALATELQERADSWDVLDLQPLQEPSRVRAFMAQRLAALGRAVDSNAAGGARRIHLSAGVELGDEGGNGHRVYAEDLAQLRKGLAALRRISRLEWASRDEASPLADREASTLLEDVVLPLGLEGRARLSRLDNADGEAVAAALVVDDRDAAVMLALAVDPESRASASRLIALEARAAESRGRSVLDVVIGAEDYALPTLSTARVRALRLRVYGASASAALARTYGAVRRSVEAAKDAPGAAAAGARAAWSKIRTAAAHVAGYERLHLYRGELWTRGIEHTSGLSLGLFSEEDFDAGDSREREGLVEGLELDLDEARRRWRRGDLAVLGRIGGSPAGIGWCARSPVPVLEIERSIRLGPGEAYIHNVFVAPQARGRAVAPSMLEFLAKELRQRDVYRAWALIGTDNVASVRAFEKAAYAAVCDVIYTRMAVADRLFVRPPDPEAKALLGL